MWAQTWEGIYDLVIPFPNAPGFDVTKKLQEVAEPLNFSQFHPTHTLFG
jgi:hypothetical protein